MRSSDGAVTEKNGLVLLCVQVQPRASRNAVRIEPDGRVRVAVTATPAEGAANKALRELIARTVGIPKSAVMILHGEKSRKKTLALKNVTVEEVDGRLLMAQCQD